MMRAFALAAVAGLIAAHAVEPGLPSRTSVAAASLRAIGAKHPDARLRNPDHLAEKLLGAAERGVLTGQFPTDALDLDFAGAIQRLSEQDRSSVSTMILRTKHFDGVLDQALRDGARQVVILGAGFDSRGYRFQERLKKTRFFEVDYGPTQENKKRRVIAALGKLPAGVRYVTMDFNKDDLLTQLRNSGYSEREKSLFIWEGVSMYLPEGAVRGILRFVREHAAAGSLLSFDYALASDANVNNPKTRFALWGEPWLFGFPGESAEGLLRGEKLQMVSDAAFPDLAAKYGLDRRNDSGLPTIIPGQRTRRICVARVGEGR